MPPRLTRQNSAIRHVFDHLQRPLLAQEVLDLAQRDVPQLGIATVYRNLRQLVEEQVLNVVTLPGDNPRYELASHPHHHHFFCRGCQKVFDVEGCPGALKHLLPAGFTIDAHDLTLYGHCPDCQP